MAAPVFNNSPLGGTVGTAYLFTWDITANSPPTTQIIGVLPSGLTLSDNENNYDPIISGTPDVAGNYPLSAWSAVGEEVTTQNFTIEIREEPTFRGFYSQE